MFSMSSSKGVICLTDDALYLYKVSGRKVFLKEVFEWDQDKILEELTAVLKGNFSSVTVLNDMVDQHYRKEKIPKVGSLDATNVVNRRLNLAFPEFPIRVFRKLDDEPTDKESGRAMLSYLFCACPDSQNIRIVTSAIRDSGIGFQGFSLLPMESEDLVSTLLQSFSQKKSSFMAGSGNKKGQKKKDKNNGWCIFVGQNASGGLRQIVVRDGKLALTRISPIVETDADISLWCQDVKREINSTMGYLSRFGYRDEDPLSVIVIANNKAKAVFEDILDFESDLYVISLGEALKAVGAAPAKNEADYITNVLHAGWVAKKLKLSASMKSGSIDSIINARSRAMLVASIGVLALVGTGYFFANSLVTLNKYTANLKVLSDQQKQVTTLYDKEIERKNALGIDVKLIQSSSEIHKRLTDKNLDPLDIIESVGRAMDGVMKLDSISIERLPVVEDIYATQSALGATGEEKNSVPSETVLKFSFPGTVDIEKGNREVLDFGERLREKFENAEVDVTRILKDVSYKGTLKSEAGITKKEQVHEDLEAEIVIRRGD